jgi:mannose-6-phosphate isomerase-like protein (cupin superfamily)
MRRVVLAHDAAGKSIVASDIEIAAAPVPGVGAIARLWASDAPATYPDDGRNPDAPGMFPPVGGARMIVAEFAPGQRIEGAEGGDGAIAWGEDGMHHTDSTDLNVVLEGEIVLSAPGGQEVTLRQGDVAVVAGADHAWRNDGDRPARVAFFLVGAHRKA